MKKTIDTIIFLIGIIGVIMIFPKHNDFADAQSTTQTSVLVNMESPNTLPLLNNMLRQQSVATQTLQGYFNTSGFLSPAAGGTGTNITGFPNGSLLAYSASNVGIGTFGQGSINQILISAGTGAFPSWGSLPAHNQIFLASGSFTAPAGVSQVYITLVGGGGGGGAGSAAGGGSSGEQLVNYPYAVTPGNSYTVTIGGAGSAGTGSGNGGTGGTTIFDALSVIGGNGGSGNITGNGAAGATVGGLNASTFNAGTSTISGAAANGLSGNYGGGGGGTLMGGGGNGSNSAAAGSSAGANTGGGGGGGFSGHNGGSGGSGIVILMY